MKDLERMAPVNWDFQHYPIILGQFNWKMFTFNLRIKNSFLNEKNLLWIWMQLMEKQFQLCLLA